MDTHAAASSRRDRGLALVSGLVPAVLATAGLTVSLTRPKYADLVSGHELGDAAMALTCGLVAALILLRRPRHPVGIVFAAIGLADGICLVATTPVDVLNPHDRGYDFAAWLSAWTWAPGLLLTVTVLPVVFPEGASGSVRRWLWRADVSLIGLVCVGLAFGSRLQTGPHSHVPNPVGVAGADQFAELAIGAVLISALGSLAELVLTLVRADEDLRRQMLPLVAAGSIVVIAVSCAKPLGTGGVLLQDGSLLLIPAAALLSVLRLRLYDLELAIGRTAGWLALSAVLIGGYVLIVEFSTDLLHVHGRLGSVIATALIAVAFGPLRALLQRWLARWLYGDRGHPYAALAHTTQVLSGGADPIGALRQAADDLAYRLRSPGVRIMRDGAVLAGRPGGQPAIAVPLRAGPLEVGRLEVLPRGEGETFSRADERLILDLCAPLTNAVAAVGLAEELRASRERLALVREAERRRVRTELHDDVGPSLAAAALQTQTARRRLRRCDTAGTEELLIVLSTTIQRAARDLRGAIDALGPRALEEVGLEEAVRSLGWSEGRPQVAVLVDNGNAPVNGVPAAVEVAAYRVICEALTNAQRHARADAITIRLAICGAELRLSVIDDGVGGAVSRPEGVGLASMQARIEELGGDFTVGVGADGTGTTVAATVPLPDSLNPAALELSS